MVSELIHRISKLQSDGIGLFPEGIFPSKRENSFFGYQRADSNIFATSSILFILNDIKNYLSTENQKKIDRIKKEAVSAYENYRNKDNLATYNFWETKPSKHFPNGYLMNSFRHFKLPDDIDDTSLIYLSKGYNKNEIIWLKEKLKVHADADKVYGTWFGKNMPIEKDVCTLCNLMYLILDSEEPLNEYDRATIVYLNYVIVSSEYLNNTFWISRHYATLPLIIYHYARLLGSFEIPELEAARNLLLEKIHEIFDSEKGWMNKVLLQTAYFKLSNSQTANSILVWNFLEKGWESKLINEAFYSFIGAPFAPLNSKINWVAPKKIFQIGWKCEAHELTLVLENLILKEF